MNEPPEKMTREEFIATYFPRTKSELPGIHIAVVPVVTSISDEEIERQDTVEALRGLALLRYAQMLQGFHEAVSEKLEQIKAADIAEKVVLSVN